MAINIDTEKIPSPSEVTNTPISFSKEEMNTLKKLRTDINKLTVSFGQLEITKIKLKQQEDLFKSELSKLEKEEASLAESLTKKYGKGTLDIETGKFTPSK